VKPIGTDVALSLALHVGGACAVLFVGRCGGGAPSEPLIRPDEIIMVEMAGPAQAESRMAQKAERAPDPPAKVDAAPPPEPVAEPASAAPPDELVLRDKKAKERTKRDEQAKADALAREESDKRRRELDREMRRRRLVEGLEDAPVGKVDRAASSPDGSASATGMTGNGVKDPELARWSDGARQKVQPNWSPIRAYCKPGLVTLVLVGVDGSGAVVRAPSVFQSSGNTGFDNAALRAVQSTPRLPAPPAKHSGGLNGLIQFSSKECP
jgi:TonB family protein